MVDNSFGPEFRKKTRPVLRTLVDPGFGVTCILKGRSRVYL